METLLIKDASIKSLKFNGYKVELSENLKGKPVAKLYKFITVGKNKDTYKLIEGYYFMNEDRRKEWVTDKMRDIKKWAAKLENKAAAKKEVRANMVNPFKVGEIYYDSWGYDQTNIDFYEVIEVKAKSVVIQSIGSSFVDSSGLSSMAAMVVPNPDHRGEIFTKPVVFYLDNDNKPVYHIKSRHGWISKYEKGDKGVYSSWYA